MGNYNAASAAKGDSKCLAYRDCVWIQLVLMYQYNLAWLTASGTSLYHCNLLAYSFLRACQEVLSLFRHFDVCGKERLPVNEELAKRVGFGLQNTMQYLLRHSEQVPDGRGQLKGENHFLFMCRSDLTILRPPSARTEPVTDRTGKLNDTKPGRDCPDTATPRFVFG